VTLTVCGSGRDRYHWIETAAATSSRRRPNVVDQNARESLRLQAASRRNGAAIRAPVPCR
jgi:hypothetical protein